ncbi:16308_t:CDS:2 [Funneliformis mosseae]|uniref:16308_t:CDS:1 n=1 Tax=Funneliformis mosseae TaxID=27381 RepID=A0A9N9DLL9_FUNMO|nr:16308_t:CDS:2 [Funneliformis mosseae]
MSAMLIQVNLGIKNQNKFIKFSSLVENFQRRIDYITGCCGSTEETLKFLQLLTGQGTLTIYSM